MGPDFFMAAENKEQTRLKTYVAIVAVVAAVLVISYYNISERQDPGKVFGRMQMGTIVEFTLFGEDKSGFEAATNAAFAEIDRLEAMMSSYKEGSEVSRITKSAGIKAEKVSPEVIAVLKTALKIAELSGGAFDPTIGALSRNWGFSGELKIIPSKEAVEESRKLVDYRGVNIDEAAGTVKLAKKGMTLNLGGVAKGYIIGRAGHILKERGVASAIAKAGGDMYVFNFTEKQKPFVIGIQNPRDEKKLIGTLSISNGAVSSSGDYERFFIKDNVRYHHILDPKTGYPAQGMQGVTIITADPALSDAMSTAVFVLGPSKGMELVKKLDADALLIDSSGNTTYTDGFKSRYNGRFEDIAAPTR